jgi:phosphoribosylamine--glycine ligase
LVIGSGAREHALSERLLESDSVETVLVSPGNPGTAQASRQLAEAGKTRTNVHGDPLRVALDARPDLVVVGPEAPLAAGLIDELKAEGLLAFGPSRAAARLEASKTFMKEFAKEAGIRSARHVTLSSVDQLDAALSEFPAPPVVKADGLCAGKGVTVAQSHSEARAAALEMLSGAAFGAAAETLVLEERIDGYEVSLHALCDGEKGLLLPFAQDHKRIGNGDTGPNTGGMGSYAPTPQVAPSLHDHALRQVLEPALATMKKRGTPFVGSLFGNLMITPSGEPVLLEFNVRFGDPETQVLMGLLDGDLCEALMGAARGNLELGCVSINRRSSVCLVLASYGYPGTPRKGDVITGIQAAEAMGDVRVLHAGTSESEGKLVTSGGRVLSVVARADSLRDAHGLAYRAADAIHFDGLQRRDDIASQALGV